MMVEMCTCGVLRAWESESMIAVMWRRLERGCLNVSGLERARGVRRAGESEEGGGGVAMLVLGVRCCVKRRMLETY